MFLRTTKARHTYLKLSITSFILFLGLGCEAPIPEGYVGVQVDGKDKAGLAHFYVGTMPGVEPRATDHEGLYLIDRNTLPPEMHAVVEDNRIEWSVFLLWNINDLGAYIGDGEVTLQIRVVGET